MNQARITELRVPNPKMTRPEAEAIINELLDEIVKLQRRRDATKGPTLAQVMEYAQELGMNSGEPERFHDYHQARGWKMGKTASAPMRDWKAGLRLWKRNIVPVGGKKNHFEL